MSYTLAAACLVCHGWHAVAAAADVLPTAYDPVARAVVAAACVAAAVYPSPTCAVVWLLALVFDVTPDRAARAGLCVPAAVVAAVGGVWARVGVGTGAALFLATAWSGWWAPAPRPLWLHATVVGIAGAALAAVWPPAWPALLVSVAAHALVYVGRFVPGVLRHARAGGV